MPSFVASFLFTALKLQSNSHVGNGGFAQVGERISLARRNTEFRLSVGFGRPHYISPA